MHHFHPCRQRVGKMIGQDHHFHPSWSPCTISTSSRLKKYTHACTPFPILQAVLGGIHQCKYTRMHTIPTHAGSAMRLSSMPTARVPVCLPSVKHSSKSMHLHAHHFHPCRRYLKSFKKYTLACTPFPLLQAVP